MSSTLRSAAIGRVALLIGVGGLLMCGLAGCITPPKESDLPWNMPPSWQGTVPMPGMPPE